jgi:tetratricopeptide (TPR) repeat protein
MKRALGILIFILLVFSFIGAYLLYKSSARSNLSGVDVIVEKHFKAYPNYYTNSEKFTDTLSLAITAMKYYTIGNYNLALNAFQKYEPLLEDDGYYYLYMGICYLKTGYSSLAIRQFTESMNSFSTFNEKIAVRWYMALAMLKAERIEDGKVVLDQLVKENTVYKKQATDILAELE